MRAHPADDAGQPDPPSPAHFYSLRVASTIRGCAGNVSWYSRPADAQHIADVLLRSAGPRGHLISRRIGPAGL